MAVIFHAGGSGSNIECTQYCIISFLFQNLPIERFWPEVNARVNYPIKTALVELDNNRVIDMDNEAYKFCVSFVSCQVASFGLQTVIASWNEHPIAGKSFFN